MKPTNPPRVIPANNARYVEIDVPGKGAHHFRLPAYGQAARLIEWARSRGTGGTEAEDGPLEPAAPASWAEAMLGADHVAGVVLGRCWYHRGLSLEAVEGDDPAAYGEAVVDELVEQRYTYRDYNALAAELMSRLVDFFNAGVAVQQEAVEEGKGSPSR